MKKPIIISVLALLAGVASGDAAILSPGAALERASKVLVTTHKASTLASKINAADVVYTVSDAKAEPALYVFAHQGTKGYVIAGADDVAAPVIGYSDDATFNPSDVPCCLAWLMDEYAKEIASARKAGVKPYNIIGRVEESAADYAPIAPICQTLWNQSAPYYDLCPMKDDKRCVTGCVATAMAQVLKVHNYPQKGRGIHEYSWLTEPLTYNFNDSVFEWDKMLNDYKGAATDEQKHAVANLMKACGVVVNMNYSPTGSGAYSTAVAPALTDYFIYGPSTTYLTRDTYGLKSWQDIAYQSLTAGCPLYVSGQNSSAGHAFVCDGYSSNGFYHINWGWGGTSNGYFLFTALDPASQGIGGSNAGYNIYEAFVFMARPATNTEFKPSVILANNGVTPSITDSTLTLTGPFRNMVNVPVVGYLSVKMIAPDGTVTYLSESNQRTIQGAGGRVARMNFTLPALRDTGLYKLEPYINIGTPEEPEWRMIYGALNKAQYALINVTADSVTVVEPEVSGEYPEVTNVVLNSRIYRGYPCSISGTLKNVNKQLEAYGLLYPCLINAAGSLATYANPLTYDVEAQESWDFNFTGTWRTTPTSGTYDFVFCTTDAQGYLIELSEPIKVTVAAPPAGTPDVKAANFTAINPENVGLNEQKFSCELTGTSAYFAKNLYMFLTDVSENKSLGYITTPMAFVGLDETKTFTFTSSWTLDPDKNYRAQLQTYDKYLATTTFRTAKGTDGVDVTTIADGLTVADAGDGLYVVTSDAAISSIAVYSMAGSIQYVPVSISGERAEINASGLPSGIYMLRISTSDGAKVIRVAKR